MYCYNDPINWIDPFGLCADEHGIEYTWDELMLIPGLGLVSKGAKGIKPIRAFFRIERGMFSPMRGTAKKFGMEGVKGAQKIWHINIGKWHLLNPFDPKTKLITGSKWKFWWKGKRR